MPSKAAASGPIPAGGFEGVHDGLPFSAANGTTPEGLEGSAELAVAPGSLRSHGSHQILGLLLCHVVLKRRRQIRRMHYSI